MIKRKYCVYCRNYLENKSNEHIIQNALGGLYESANICCSNCNNYISKYIDVPFTKLFNPFISRINNITKTNNKNSPPSCSGIISYNNKIYKAVIKNNKVVYCPDLSKELCCDISKLDLKIICYDISSNISIDDSKFRNGLCKIAFNFALEKGISSKLLLQNIKITKKNNNFINDIIFNYKVIPFIPLNPMDEYIELYTDIDIYHNLILFSQDDMLWCYIDLFNTFQYYILLSDQCGRKNNIHKTYLQLVQKIDRTLPNLYIRKPKHILTYSMIYNVESCLDLEVFKNRTYTSIRKESQIKNMVIYFSNKMRGYLKFIMQKEQLKDKLKYYLKHILTYTNENDYLIEKNFRTITNIGKKDSILITSYPLFIHKWLDNYSNYIQIYKDNKLRRLNDFISNINN